MLFKKDIENLAKYGEGEYFSENLEFNEIIFNSKKIKPGDIFLPLKGKTHDGHDFISEAYSQGAICVVSEKKIPQKNIILVENTNSFLRKIAKKQRDLFKGLVVGITGSNGKTTSKETIYKFLSSQLGHKSVYKSPGNYNNFFGLCFSLLELKDSHQVGCFEIGTNNKGEIAELAEILQMDISMITNIGSAHLEGLKDIDGVANEKTDIFKFTKEGGECFGNIPKKYLKLAKEKSFGKKTSFSKNTSHLDLLKNSLRKINSLLKIDNVSNIELEKFVSKDIHVPGRFELKQSKFKALIIDDSYNANPDSFLFAFEKIKKLNKSKKNINGKNFSNLKKICVMGIMGELGSKSDGLHKEIVEKASLIFDLVLAVDFKLEGCKANVNFLERNDIEDYLKDYLNEEFLIFFKGSRSVKMENIIDNLI